MLLQSSLEVALSIVRANPTVLEGLGAQLEGNIFEDLLISGLPSLCLVADRLVINILFNLNEWFCV